MTAQALKNTATIEASQAMAQEAHNLLAHLEKSPKLSVSLTVSGEASEVLGAELVAALKATLSIISQGGHAQVIAVPKDLTTTVAARRIGVSRPTLMKLIREGKMPAHQVGTHWRVRTADVDAYRAQLLAAKTAEQKAAFEKLMKLDEELGVLD